MKDLLNSKVKCIVIVPHEHCEKEIVMRPQVENTVIETMEYLKIYQPEINDWCVVIITEDGNKFQFETKENNTGDITAPMWKIKIGANINPNNY